VHVCRNVGGERGGDRLKLKRHNSLFSTVVVKKKKKTELPIEGKAFDARLKLHHSKQDQTETPEPEKSRARAKPAMEKKRSGRSYEGSSRDGIYSLTLQKKSSLGTG